MPHVTEIAFATATTTRTCVRFGVLEVAVVVGRVDVVFRGGRSGFFLQVGKFAVGDEFCGGVLLEDIRPVGLA